MSEKMLYLEWDDSISHSNRIWRDKQDANDMDLMCQSCGFVIREDGKSVTLACSQYGDSMSGDMTIPKTAIRKRRVLRHK